jgi:CheY-like chemotaxis protein
MSERTVLVVDDETDIREMLRFAFMAAGYKVDTAANGLDALEIIHKNSPTAVLLDLMMPRMSGYELVETLRTEGRLTALPVVILTASSLDGVNVARLDGTREILQKGSMDITNVVSRFSAAIA